MQFSFFVPVDPIPFMRVDGRGSARFNPTRYTRYKKEVADYALAAALEHNLRGCSEQPVKLELYFRRSFNTTSSRYGDLDNLVKAILDAFTGVIYVDDSQVVEICAAKYQSSPKLVGTKITVEYSPKIPQSFHNSQPAQDMTARPL